MKKITKNNGITLIALVITIIVLLILAGITLRIALNGGILNKSQTAVNKYSEESAREKLSLAIFNYKMGVITGEAGTGENQKTLNDYIIEIDGQLSEAEDSKYYEVELDGYLFWVDKETLEIISKGPSNPVPPTNIKFSSDTDEANIGEEKILSLEREPQNASMKYLKWSVDNEEIATIKNGVLIGKKEGTVIVTVTSTEDATVTANCTVTIKAVELTGISLNKQSTTISVGKTETLEIKYEPANATYKDITWSTDDSKIATIDKNTGLITGIKAGTTKIIATSVKYPTIKAECEVTIEQVLSIENEAQLYKFAQTVNSGTTYQDYTVKLANSITLNPGITYNYDMDTGLVEVADGTNKFYIGTGNPGDTSGNNTIFDSSASQSGQYYLSNTSTETATSTGNELILEDGVTCNTITLNNITLKKWEPIGSDSTNVFSGIFDGQNNTIEGIYSINPNNLCSFFGYVKNSNKIKDCIIKKSLIIGSHASAYISNALGNINLENIHSKENIILGSGNIGGIIGSYSYTNGYSATLNKCSNSSIIISTGNRNGGIVGAFSNGDIKECYNSGNIIVKGRHNYCAGIVGYTLDSYNNTTNIKYCYNTGNISGYDNIAGIIAKNYAYQNIENCYNSGTIISSKGSCGGIINGGSSAIIRNCYNSGTIEDKGNYAYVGGISGNDGRIYSCYNSGKIISNSSSKVYGCITGQGSSNRLPTNCAYIYYSDGKPTTGIGSVSTTGWSGSLDTGCAKYSESTWPYNILGVVNSSTNEAEQYFTTTTGRDENHPVLKWEIKK